jgi:ABC-2 type transport system permease protein
VEAKVRLELDQSNVTVANSILKVVNEAALKASSSMGVEAAVTLDNSHAIYAEDAVLRDFTVPGITVFDVFVLTFILTILAFVSERTSGNLARLRVTPLEDSELVVGYALAFSIIGIVQAGATLAIIVLVFKVMVAGSILLAFLVVALLGVLSLSLGMLLSTLAKRDAQAIQFVALVIMPSLLLGGCFWPLESLPAWVRPLSYAIPPRYAAEAMRAVMLRGWGIGQIWVELAAMAAITVGCLGLSVVRLRGDRGR